MKPPIRKPLRKGALVYHGTSAAEDFTDLVGPAWVSDARSVARNFVGWAGGTGPARILVFRVLKAPALALLTSDFEYKKFVYWVENQIGVEADPGPIEFAEQICDHRHALAGIDGWHIPTNYHDGSDTMLCEPEQFLEFVGVELVENLAR